MVSAYDKSQNIEQKRAIAKQAASLVQNSAIIGLGSGSTMELFVEALAERMEHEQLSLSFVASSKKMEAIARQYQFQIKNIESLEHIDQAFDGADCIDRQHNLIKGGGGSLFRERQLLLMANEKYILADDSKFVEHFANLPIPLEVVPFNIKFTVRKLEEKGFRCKIRGDENTAFITDNGNLIVDIVYSEENTIEKVFHQLKMQFGVVEVGIFLNDKHILL